MAKTRSTSYDGFLSYSHAADDLLAPRLQAGLQQFARPWWKRRALHIFRDDSSLTANPHLWASIEQALTASDWFVLLLSPDAASSEWVNREVRYWRDHKDPDRILPVVTDGTFGWSDGDVTGDAVPPALREVFADEPRWIDLRFARTETQLDLRHASFRDAIANIAAAIRGVPKDELQSEEIRQHRRTVRTAWSAGLTILLLGALATIAAVQAVEAQREAELERDLARARYLASSALMNLEVDPERSILLALEAVDTASSLDTPISEPWTALHKALGAFRVVERIPGGEFVDFSPDGTLLAVGVEGGTSIRSVEERLEVMRLPSPEGATAVWATFSPDGRTLAVSYDNAGRSGPLVLLWDAVTGEIKTSIVSPDFARGYRMVFNPTGDLLAIEVYSDESVAIDASDIVTVWEVASLTEAYRIDPVGEAHARGPSFSSDGALVAVAESDGLRLYRADDGQLVQAPPAPTDWDVEATAFDPNGNRVAALSQFPPVVGVWDVDAGAWLYASELGSGPATIEWSPDGKFIAVSGYDGIPRLLDEGTGKVVMRLLGQPFWVPSVSFHPTGRTLAGAGTTGSWATLVWDVSPAHQREAARIDTPYPGVEFLEYSADGESVLVASDEPGTLSTVARIDITTGEVVASLPDQLSDFPYVPFLAPRAGLVASVGQDHSAAIYDSVTFEKVADVPEGHYVRGLSFDGRRAVLNDFEDGPVVVAEVGSWDVLMTLDVPRCRWSFFSPDGRLVTCWDISTWLGHLIDIDNGRTVATFDSGWPQQFSVDGSWLEAKTFDGGLEVYDVAALESGSTPEEALIWSVQAHDGVIALASLNADTSLISTVGADDQLRVWDTKTGRLVADLGTLYGSWPVSAMSPDGSTVIGEDYDGTIQIFTLQHEELIGIAESRVTRGFTSDECATYHIDSCADHEAARDG